MNLRKLKTKDDFYSLLRMKKKTCTYILYGKKVENFYESFNIPKRNGELREIAAPKNQLLYAQKRIANILYNDQDIIWKEGEISPKISHGFERGKSIITNAKIHVKKRYVLNVDLENFFDSFHFGRVKGFFEKNSRFKVPEDIALMIAQFSCYKGKLPQGAPTSPIITNLICRRMDHRILILARRYKVDYTRYADDLTFSTNKKIFMNEYRKFLNELDEIVVEEGFKINKDKNKFQLRNQRQIVTGISVNDKIGVSKKFRRETRAMVHHLYKDGTFDIDGKKGTISQLNGRLAYINQIDKWNNQRKIKENNKVFSTRENCYKEFILYKTFYMNSKPLIVTEGKTDILYLKAALKNLYVKYPQLIRKTPKGEFKYKISFLKKTRANKYLLDIAEGADTFQKIYTHYISKKKYRQISKEKYRWEKNSENKFEHYGLKSKFPVFLLFDNESSNDKPLPKFLRKINKDQRMKIKKEIEGEFFSDVVHNLHLLTLPKDRESDVEIENLFDEQFLNEKIGDRSLNLNDDCSKDKYYSKDELSKKVMKEYNRINFANFIPIFDRVVECIERYDSKELGVSIGNLEIN